MEDLNAFCIIYLVTLRVILFSVNSKSIENWKQKLLIWNYISSLKFQSFRLAVTYIHLSLTSLPILLKHKSISFVNDSVNFKVPYKFLCRQPLFPDDLFASCDYAMNDKFWNINRKLMQTWKVSSLCLLSGGKIWKKTPIIMELEKHLLKIFCCKPLELS